MLRRLSGLTLLLPAAAVIAQPTNNRLAPAGPWQVDYASRACLLVRPLTGNGGINQFTLAVEPFDRGAEVQLRGAGRVSPGSGSADLFADAVLAAKGVPWSVLSRGSEGGLRTARIEDRQRVFGAMRGALSIRPDRIPVFDIQLSDFPTAARALDRCIDHLHEGFGVDPAELKSIAVYPKGLASEFIRKPRKHAFAEIFYWVTPTGQVEGCRVLQAGPDRGFSARVCRDVEARSRLTPAQDANGKSVRAPKIEFIGNVLVRVS